MSSDNCLHSFTISPESSEHIGTIRNKKKSQFVSEAIIHYRNWRHTDHTQLKISNYPGVKEVKDINMAHEEIQLRMERWVIKCNELQQEVIRLEALVSLLQGRKKWYQFWK